MELSLKGKEMDTRYQQLKITLNGLLQEHSSLIQRLHLNQRSTSGVELWDSAKRIQLFKNPLHSLFRSYPA